MSLLDIRSFINSYVSSGEGALVAKSGCVFVETGLRFSAAADYRSIDKQELAAQSAEHYEFGWEGYLQIKESSIRRLAESKDVGLRCLDRITYYSDKSGRYSSYSLRDNGVLDSVIPLDLSDVRLIQEYKKRYL